MIPPWWMSTNKLVMLSQREDIVVAFGWRAMLPGICWTSLLRQWSLGASISTGIIYPECILGSITYETLVIEKEEWAHLSNPASLTHYWEPTQGSGDFHRTFALALCRTAFHDCEDTSRRKEYILLVCRSVKNQHSMWQYRSQQPLTNFEMTPKPLPLYYWSGSIGIPSCSLMYTLTDTIIIFTIMHGLREALQCGSPPEVSWAPCFIMHSRLGISLPLKQSLPPTFLDHPTKFPIDSCVREYWDWTTDCEDRTSPDEHFVWLSNEFTPYQTDLGTPYVLPDFTLGLPAVGDWPQWTGDVPWILDPAEHPRPAAQSHHESRRPQLRRQKAEKKEEAPLA